jgi:hypothetical protein
MKKADQVREPIQVYMASHERRLLDQVASETGLSRAEVLRQGLRAFAAQRFGNQGPMKKLMAELRKKSLSSDVAENHDDYLVSAYRDLHER